MRLTPDLLLAAYRRSLFPMAIDEAGTIGWFSPDPRTILPLDNRFHVSHGLRRTLKTRCPVLLASGPVGRESEAPACPRSDRGSAAQAGASPATAHFRISIDQDFEPVMRACARRREGTWISGEIIAAYGALHRLGHAHSVEVRHGNELVGGLYGVHLGGAFFGESMFHRETDASKVALVALVQRLRARGFSLLDTQWLTPHLARFGAYEITRRQYRRRLARALAQDCRF